MFFVYILYSPKIDRFYIGATHDVKTRLDRHNSDYYDNKWSVRGKPWQLFLEIPCLNKQQALHIEQHIKRMKSKTYIYNLIKYPEIVDKLKLKYPSL